MDAPGPEDYGWVQHEHRVNVPAIVGLTLVVVMIAATLLLIGR